MTASTFTFVEKGAHAAICWKGQEILRLERNSHFFGGHFAVWDQVMVPGGQPEVAGVPQFSSAGHYGHVTDVRYRVTQDPGDLALTVTPTNTQRGPHPLTRVSQQVTFRVREDQGRFVWTQDYSLEALTDIDPHGKGAEDVLGFYRYPRPDGLPGLYIQYADPQPCNASGPAVPMARDWQMHYEPYVGPDTFRAHWKRDYVTILFQDPDESFHVSDLNKTKWFNLIRDNRRARLCHPQGLLYLIKDTGEAMEIRCNAPSHYHHVCEWGMDFHFWLDMEPFLKNGILKAGTRVTASTTARMVTAEVAAPVLKKAARIELTERERFFADLPAYEEPENTFTVPALERLDAQFWQPKSEGCRWDKTGGHEPNSGRLLITNNRCLQGEWHQDRLGPSQWGNPFMPGARYRLSAWVRMETVLQEPDWPVPMIGVEAWQYNGPATSSPASHVDMGWAGVPIPAAALRAGRLEWTHVELVTPPFPSYVLRAALKLRLVGRGTAEFSNVRWELADAPNGEA